MRTQSQLKNAGTGLLLFAMLTAGVAIAPSARADDEDKGWLGVSTQTLTDELREGMDSKYKGAGALVSKVVVGSPAEKAGVRKGDVITTVNSKAITTSDGLNDAIGALKPGSFAAVKVMRDGTARSFNVKLGSRTEEYGSDSDFEWHSAPMPPEPPTAPHAPRAFYFRNGEGWGGMSGFNNIVAGMPRGRLGVRVEDLNPDLATYFGNVTKGALVLSVVDESPAEKAGLKAGDIITKVGDQSIDDTEDLMRTLREREGKVSLGVMRKGTARTIEAELEPRPEPRVYRWNSDGDGKSMDSDEMRKEMEQLKKEMEQLKKDMGGSPKKSSS